jgi:hypothetical protein
MILQLFHRQDQEILRLSTTAEAGSSTFSIDKINKFFDCRQQSDRFSSDHR